MLTAALIKLVVMPGLVALLCLPILGNGELGVSIVLLAGMPTMMATILLSERYGLDTELLASIMVTTTLFYFLALPVWLAILLG